MKKPMKKPLKAFITYSHENADKRKRLAKVLAVMVGNREIEIWHDAKILPGDEWEKEITENLKKADILLYLASIDSLASKNCNKELADILSKVPNVQVISIILEDCDFEFHALGKFEALPTKNKSIVPVSHWNPHSRAWKNVADGIRNIISSPSDKPPQGGSDTPPPTPKGPQPVPLTWEQESAWHFNRANFFSMLNNNDLAIADYDKAIELNHDDAAAYNNRGIVRRNKGDYDLAIVDFNKAIELNSNHAKAYNNRGVVYRNKYDYDLAIADYNKAIALKPNYATAYNNRGNVYNNKGDYDLAIADYNKAIVLNSDYADAYANRGVIYGKKNDNDLAFADFNKAIALDPNNVVACNNRGIIYNSKGDYKNAIADFNKAMALDPDYIEAYASRGITKKELLNDYKGARADFQYALRLAERRGDKPLAARIQKDIDKLPPDSDS